MDWKHFAYACVCAAIGCGTVCTLIAMAIPPRSRNWLQNFYSRPRSEFSPIALKFRDASLVFGYLTVLIAIAWYFL